MSSRSIPPPCRCPELFSPHTDRPAPFQQPIRKTRFSRNGTEKLLPTIGAGFNTEIGVSTYLLNKICRAKSALDRFVYPSCLTIVNMPHMIKTQAQACRSNPCSLADHSLMPATTGPLSAPFQPLGATFLCQAHRLDQQPIDLPVIRALRPMLSGAFSGTTRHRKSDHKRPRIPTSSFLRLSTTTVHRKRNPSSPPVPPAPLPACRPISPALNASPSPPKPSPTRSIWVSICRKGYLTNGNSRSAGSKSRPLLHSFNRPCWRGLFLRPAPPTGNAAMFAFANPVVTLLLLLFTLV